MDSRNISSTNRTGSLGNPSLNRPTQGNQPQQDPRTTASTNPNRTTSVGQTGSQYSNFMFQVPTVNRPPPAPVRIDNELEGEFYDNAGEQQAVLAWSTLP